MTPHQLASILGKLAAAAVVGIGAIIGWVAGPDGDLSTGLGDALAGALTGGTVVVIAALTVRWVNAIADRRDKAAADAIGDSRKLVEELRAIIADERAENGRLRQLLEQHRDRHHQEEA